MKIFLASGPPAQFRNLGSNREDPPIMSQTINGKVPQYAGGLIFVTQSRACAPINEQGDFSVPVQSNPTTQQVILIAPQGSPYAPLSLSVTIGPGATDISYQASQVITTVGTYIGITNLTSVGTDDRGLAIPGSGGGGGTPSGPDTSVQFDNGGAFGGDAKFVWNNTAKQLIVGPPDSTLDPNIQDYWSPSSLLVTNSGLYATIGIEAQSPNGLTGLGIISMAQATDAAYGSTAFGLQVGVQTDRGTNDVAGLTAGYFQINNFTSGQLISGIGVQVGPGGNNSSGTILLNFGVKVEDQTAGISNWAIKTGLGLVEFGDVVIAPRYRGTLTTPASATAPGTQGDFCDDADFHYVCVATNTWKRVALSTW